MLAFDQPFGDEVTILVHLQLAAVRFRVWIVADGNENAGYRQFAHEVSPWPMNFSSFSSPSQRAEAPLAMIRDSVSSHSLSSTCRRMCEFSGANPVASA